MPTMHGVVVVVGIFKQWKLAGSMASPLALEVDGEKAKG